MNRAMQVCVVVALFAAWPAQSQRPSIGGVDAEQKRLSAAICAKSDVDGDVYRPFVCEARCDCLAAALATQVPSSCQQTSSGVFTVGFETGPGTCSASGSSGSCSNSSFFQCSAGLPCQIPGEQCAISPFSFGFCLRSCSSDLNCPSRPASAATLSGVTVPDAPEPVACGVLGAQTTSINSNDALECLAQIEAVVGPCN